MPTLAVGCATQGEGRALLQLIIPSRRMDQGDLLGLELYPKSCEQKIAERRGLRAIASGVDDLEMTCERHGSGTEAAWKQLGRSLEAAWKQIGSRFEAACNRLASSLQAASERLARDLERVLQAAFKWLARGLQAACKQLASKLQAAGQMPASGLQAACKQLASLRQGANKLRATRLQGGRNLLASGLRAIGKRDRDFRDSKRLANGLRLACEWPAVGFGVACAKLATGMHVS
eukprot:13474354-Alexandrium_andersonii.AAC.2